MAKKKVQSRRTPRTAEPRMYGDGKPSQSQGTAPATPRSAAAPAVPAGRTAGATPRAGTGSTGAFARSTTGLTADYRYVVNDLRRLLIVAAAILGLLVVMSFFIR